jgi:hypothetical protein
MGDFLPCAISAARLDMQKLILPQRGRQVFGADLNCSEQASAVYPGKRVVGTLSWERERQERQAGTLRSARAEPQIQENSLRGRHAGRLKKKDDAPFRLRASLM